MPLSQGACLFACRADCDPIVGVVGLRDPDDCDRVIWCPVHLPDLRRVRPIEGARLAKYLRIQFIERADAASR